MPLPEWMTSDKETVPDAHKGRRSWVAAAADKLRWLTALHKPGKGIVRIDPRIAIIAFVGLIVCATFLRNIPSLALCWKIGIVLALAVGARYRALFATSLAVGVFTALMTVPAATSTVTTGKPLLELANLTITLPGVKLAAVVVLRTLSCLALGFGLFASNRPEELFAALRWFRAPGIFVTVLMMTYRYIHVVLRAATESHMARQSRVAEENDLRGARRWLGERVGALFTTSRRLGEEVHQASVARGFDGEWMPPPARSLRARDLSWVGISAGLAALLLVVDRLGIIG